MTAYIDVDVDERWKVGVDPGRYAGYRTGASPWIGELAINCRFTAKVAAEHDDIREAARLSAATVWRSYGFLVGEAPRVADDFRTTPAGEVVVTVTGLVTIPPYWTGTPEILGQSSIWEAL